MKNIKKILILILIIGLSNLTKSQSYITLSEFSGKKCSNEDKIELESITEDIKDIIPGNSFGVYDFSYYTYNKSMEGGKEEIFSNVLSSITTDDYFIFIREILSNGAENIEVKIKLPSLEGCITEKNEEEIVDQMYFKVSEGGSAYYKNQFIALEDILQKLTLRVGCCFNRDDCITSFSDDENILNELYEYGYSAYSIEINYDPAFKSENENSRNYLNCIIEKHIKSGLKFKIGNYNNFNLDNEVCEYASQFTSDSKIYITDNTTYRDWFSQIQIEALSESHDFQVHFHLYDSSDPDKIPDLILFRDYSNCVFSWEDFNSVGTFAPFELSWSLPILNKDKIPEYPGLFNSGWMPETTLLRTQKIAHNNNIPMGNIHMFAFEPDFNLALEISETLSPLGGGRETFYQSIMFKETLEENLYWACSNADFPSNSIYFGFDPTGKYIEGETSNGISTFIHIDNIPYLDDGLITIKRGRMPQAAGIGNSIGKAISYGKKGLKIAKNKGIVKSTIGKTIYLIKVNNQVYVGRTSRDVYQRIYEHIATIEKWEGKIPINNKTMDQIVKSRDILAENIGNPKTYRGIEQLFLEAYKKSGTVLNEIQAIDPVRKTQHFKECLNLAKEYMKKIPNSKLPKEMQPIFKNLDKFVTETFQKYGI